MFALTLHTLYQSKSVNNHKYIYIYIIYNNIYIYIYIYISGSKWSTTHRVLKSDKTKMSMSGVINTWVVTKPLRWQTGGHIVFMIAYILRSSWFCQIWALCGSWITYGYLHYDPRLACWALFGSLGPAMCNRTSRAQVCFVVTKPLWWERRGHITFMIA